MVATAYQPVYTALALLCAACAAVTDVRERRIPNVLTMAGALAGLGAHFALDGWSGLASSTLSSLVAGSLFLILYLAGGLGAGDVKLLAAVGCLSGLAPLKVILFATALSGGVAGLFATLFHGRLRETLHNTGSLVAHHRRKGMKPHSSLQLGNPATLRIPYAVPVTVGCLAAALLSIREALA